MVKEADGRVSACRVVSVTVRRYVAEGGRRFYRAPGRNSHGKCTKSDARLTESSLKRLEAGNTSGQVL